MNHVIKGAVLERNYRKMTMNSFVKFHDKKMWEPHHCCYIQISVIMNINDVCYKGTVWEYSGSVVECLTRDQGAKVSSLTGVTVLCP